MRQFAISSLSWVVPVVLMPALAGVCVLQWNSLRVERDHWSHAFERTNSLFQNSIEFVSKSWRSLADDLRREVASLRTVAEQLDDERDLAKSDEIQDRAVGTQASQSGEDQGTQPGLNELPALPEGVRPHQMIGLPLVEVAKDPRFNPSGKRLSSLETARAVAEWTRAKAATEVLESEIRLGMIEARERLRSVGAFVEYAPGEKYLTEKGVLTAAETLEGGSIRMFYLRPEEFPVIYEKRNQKAAIAETALRRIVEIFKG